MVSSTKKSPTATTTFRRIPSFLFPSSLSPTSHSSRHHYRRPSPVLIPEIIEQILSHVSQHQLQHTTRLVCRLWFATSQSVMVHSLSWSDTVNLPEQQRLLSKMGRVNVLTIVVHPVPSPHQYFKDLAWKYLEEACRGLDRQRRQFLAEAASTPSSPRADTSQTAASATATTTINSATLVTSTPSTIAQPPMALQELHVGATTNLIRRLLPLLPFIGPTLRVIRIESVLGDAYQLDQILRSCPQLLELYVEPVKGFIPFASQELSRLSTARVAPTGTLSSAVASTAVTTTAVTGAAGAATTFVGGGGGGIYAGAGNTGANASTTTNPEPIPRLKLQILVLIHMTVLEPLLRPILESCPDLRVLKVTGFQRDRSEESLVPTPALGVLAHPPSSPDAINGEANETNNISIDSNGGVNRRFLTRLAQWCPRLESIQLSQRDTLSSPSDIRLLLKFFPQVHSLGFSTRDVLPSIFSELRVQETITNAPQSPQSPSSSSLPTPQLRPRTVLNTITTLEICPSQSAFEEATLNKVLHEFLCDSPQLLHLKAEHVQFYVEYFDILPRHDRSDLEEQLRGSGSGGAGDGNDSDGEGAAMTNASSEAVSGTIIPQPSQEQLLQLQNMPRTRIWACRKLQTLHISLKSMSTSTALLPGTTLRTSFPFNKRSSSSPDQSRAIFGYLSRVLPLLRDLALSKSRLNLTLEGGFCLLTRMRDLEKLTLQIRKPPRPVPDNTIGGSGSSSSPSTPPCLFKERDFNWLVRTPSPWQIVKWSLQGPIGMDSNSSNNKHRNSSNYKQDSLATTVERKTVRTKLSGLFNPSSTSVMPLEAPRRKSDGDTIDAALKGKSRSDIATRTRAATTTTVSPAPSSITTTTSSASAGSARLHQDERRVLTSGSSTLGIKFLRRTQSSRQPLRAQTKKSHSQPVEHDEGENRNDITTATSPTNDDNLEQEQERQQSLDALSLIQFLGQDKDIKAALRERALDYRVGCWSKLEQLTIYFVESWDSDLSSLEKIIRRMRPEIQFSSMFMSGL